MKRVLIFIMGISAVFLLSACVTDTPYSVGKTIYTGGKAAVEANSELLGEKTLKTLKKVDGVASTYDHTRTKVKEAFEIKKEQ